MNRVDCLGMGIVPLDILHRVERLPRPGEKINAVGGIIQGGGPVPNTLVGLSRLGLVTAAIVVVGDDLLGEMSLQELRKEKVDVSQAIVKKRPSAAAIGLIGKDTGERTISLLREIDIKPRDLKLGPCPIPKVIHLDGRDVEANIKLARWGKRHGAMISLDIGSMRNDVTPLLPWIDHLVVADAYALPFTRSRSAKSAVRKLTDHCPGTVVVTSGLKGSLGYEDSEWATARAIKVTSVDTTGAGDSFHAGYIYGLIQGWPLKQRLEFGAATSALKCTKMGARTGAPTLAEVKRFMRN